MADRLSEAYEVARRRAEASWAARSKYCNRNRRPRRFNAGDLVYLKVPAIKPGHFPKFHCPWTGPHRVTERLSEVTYRIGLATGGTTVVHVNRLKPAYRDAIEPGVAEPPGSEEGEATTEDEDLIGVFPGYLADTEEEYEGLSSSDREEPTGQVVEPRDAESLAGPSVQEGAGVNARTDADDEHARSSESVRGETVPEVGREEPDPAVDARQENIDSAEVSPHEDAGREGDEEPDSGEEANRSRVRTRREVAELRRRARERAREFERGMTDSHEGSPETGGDGDSTWTPRNRHAQVRSRSPYHLRSHKGWEGKNL